MTPLTPLRFVLLGLAVALPLRADPAGPNLLPGDFESGTKTYNPWAGVDDAGHLSVGVGAQFATNDEGKIKRENFGASLAVGDLNGDGLPDLVVADSRGYFWFFPNSGKPGAPAFTHGEVMPIWLGGEEKDGAVVPRIQLIDFANEGKLDLVAGTFLGELYYLHNLGTPTMPSFLMPQDRADIRVATLRGGRLWCNYLAPFLFSWSATGRLDLLMGDGTYSANSIYLFLNQGTNSHPLFDEKYRMKLIPGLGREQLTPQMVDWNGDGRLDVICGERQGYVDLYLNKADKATDLPQFDPTPQHVKFGPSETIGSLVAICAADLNQDKLFDLLTCTDDGEVLYAPNTGSAGHPAFGPLEPLAGKNPFPPILAPGAWSIPTYHPYGAAYELLEVVNSTLDPNFSPPPDFPGKGGLKFSVMKPNNVYFRDLYLPSPDKLGGEKRRIRYATTISASPGDTFKISFWVRCDGTVSDLQAVMDGAFGRQQNPAGGGGFNVRTSSLDVGPTWSQVSETLHLDNPRLDRRAASGASLEGDFNFFLDWTGDGTLYFDGFSLKKVP